MTRSPPVQTGVALPPLRVTHSEALIGAPLCKLQQDKLDKASLHSPNSHHSSGPNSEGG